MSFIGDLFGTGTNNWIEGGIGTALADARNYGTLYGNSQWSPLAGQITNNTTDVLPQTTYNMMSGMTNAQNTLGNFLGNLPQVQQAFGQYTTPQMQQAFGNMGGSAQGITNAIMSSGAPAQALGNVASSLQPSQGLAQQVFAGGGWTPQYQQGFDTLTNFLGQGTPGLQTSAGAANSLVGNMGADPFNQALQGYALNAAQQGGMTPTLAMLQNPIQGIIGRQGMNPGSQALLGQGLNLFNQQALMSPGQAESLARNQAATSNAQQAKQAETAALARGGGPGAVVANGMQNQGMADFANQAAQNESSAATTALNNQQQLQLQQQLGGGNVASNAQQMANSLFLQGMGLAPTTQNAATNYLNAYLGGGLGAGQNQIGMLGQGQNLAQMLQSGQLGGINAMTGMMGAENQYALGAGNLANSLAGGQTNALGQQGNLYQNAGNLYNAQGNLYNTGIQSMLGQGQLGNAQFGNYLQGMGTGISGLNNYINAANNAYSNQINPLLGLAGQANTLTGQGLGAEAGLFGGMGNALAQGQAQSSGQLGGMLAMFGL